LRDEDDRNVKRRLNQRNKRVHRRSVKRKSRPAKTVVGVRIQLRERQRGIVIAVEMNWARRRKGITLS